MSDEIFVRYRPSEHSATPNGGGLQQSCKTYGTAPAIRFCDLDCDVSRADASHAYINRARTSNEVVKGYEIMARIVSDFKVLPIASFDAGAATEYVELESQRIQLAKMDARIAAIALSHKLILLTRNHRDFGKVAGLVIENWTVIA